jgi:hypothetical protein
MKLVHMDNLTIVYGEYILTRKSICFFLYYLGQLQLEINLIWFHIFSHGVNQGHQLQVKMLMLYSMTNMLSIEIEFN